MEKTNETELLSGYRVMDLADEKGVACGKILAELGADVVKVEPPCGDRGRHRGPSSMMKFTRRRVSISCSSTWANDR